MFLHQIQVVSQCCHFWMLAGRCGGGSDTCTGAMQAQELHTLSQD